MKTKVAVAQMTSADDVAQNFEQLEKLLQEADRGGAELISFPENSLYLRVDLKGEKGALAETDSQLKVLSAWAKEKKKVLHLGSVPMKKEGEIFNSTLWIDAEGNLSFPYNKIHLFDIELAGKEPIRESDYYRAGTEPAIVESHGFKIGLSICYDLRFSELYSFYNQKKVDVLMVPAAFLVETGRAHWEVLLRARAIENQAYVIAAAQTGLHVSTLTDAKRASYGHSMIIDPWGRVLADAGEEMGVIFAEIETEAINKARQQIPMELHRKLR